MNPKVFALLIFLLNLSGLYLFKQGFLLSRTVVDKPVLQVYRHDLGTLLSRHNLSSLSRQLDELKRPAPVAKHKILLVLIDALRFDFAAEQPGSTQPYHNHLAAISTLADTQPFNAQLFHFLADPPTTTMQRLKALMSGSLPTFIDAGDNFASGKVPDDTLLRTLRSAGKKMVMMGDDTWLSLYERDLFSAIYPYPSFEVFDLHTVDNGCLENIVKFIDFKQGGVDRNWDLLVTHFLGVDHAGHRYGPEHPEMRSKLLQLNEFLGSLFQAIDSDTTIFVFGDHGMDSKGDHGGESLLEVDAGLFVYSKNPVISEEFLRLWSRYEAAFAENDLRQLDVSPTFDTKYRSVFQIDMVPTIALLLGIEIPFGNLGMIIPQFFVKQHVTCQQDLDDTELCASLNLLSKLDRNLEQVYRYIANYYAVTQDLDNVLAEMDLFYSERAPPILDRLAMSDPLKPEYHCAVMDLSMQIMKTLRRALDQCKDEWARFDVTTMGCGLAILLFSVLGICYSMSITVKRFSILTLPVAAILTHSFIFGSNSFVIFEDAVVFYLLQSMTLLLFIRSASESQRWSSLACLAITRLTFTSTICRDEQLPFGCVPTFHTVPYLPVDLAWISGQLATSASVSMKSLSMLLLVSLLLPAAHKALSRGVSNTNGDLTTTFLRVTLLSLTIHWGMEAFEERIDKDNQHLSTIILGKIWAARLGFLTGFTSLLNSLFGHSCDRIQKALNTTTSVFMIIVCTQLPTGAWILSLGMLAFVSLIHYASDAATSKSTLILISTVISFLAHHQFFATGHQATFSAIQFQTGFIGLESFDFYLSGALVALNSVGVFLLFAVAQSIPFAMLKNGRVEALLLFLLHSTLAALTSAVAAAILRRHLMVWNVFAPRFMLAAVQAIVTIFALVFVG